MKTINTSQEVQHDPLTQELVYCGLDTMVMLEINEHLEKEFTPSSRKTYADSLSFLGPALDMMHRGFKIDLKRRDEILPVMQERRLKYQGMLNRLAHVVWGQDLNINSSPQMLNFFYEWLFIPTQYENKKGELKPSCGRKAMEKVRDNYVKGMPCAILVMALRDLDKEITTLTKGLHDGRWHANFNVAGTDTWRWSSSKHPVFGGSNLQNINDELRRVFTCDNDFLLFSCDQQGAEARGVAYITGDENYIKAVNSGDVHTMVAGMVFGFEPTKENSSREFYRGQSYRQISKKFSHGSSYNGTPRTLAIQANTEIALVEDFQKKFFARFPGIQEWHRWTSRELQTKGVISNAFGDVRQFWDRLWDDATLRAAIAFQPQSLVGKLTALVLRRLWEEYDHRDVQLLANGHDAIIFQIRKNKIAELLPRVLESLKYPIPVKDIHDTTREMLIPWDASVGLNWGKKFKEDKTGKKIIVNPGGLEDYSPQALEALT